MKKDKNHGNNMEQLVTGKANLDVFAETLSELAEENRNIMVVTSDSRGSARLAAFAARLPDQIVEVGIAEQNLVGVAAGLASAGKTVFAVSPACFLTARALEQIKNDIAYSNQPVTLVGISAGVSYGPLGSTHHSIHDVAVLRAIHNIGIMVPADNFETREAVLAAAASQRPVYLKLGKKAMPHLPRESGCFEPGKESLICRGNDVAIIACGETVAPAYQAAQKMQGMGITTEVISMHTVKPPDREAVIRAASKCRAVITTEEHSISGGLGEACASLFLEASICKPFKILGIPDEETVTGSQTEIFCHYGISAEGITKTALSLISLSR